MNKASKHIQNGATGSSAGSSLFTSYSGTSTTVQKNVINSVMSFLPDNRPITSLQIVEDYERCPKNFLPINRTYDQDADADMWRESNILFGKQTTRYLCLSKTEGLPEYVVETLKIIAEKIQPPKGFSLLSRTADSEQKAWRKRQIAYKLSKRDTVVQAVTDVILCSKLRIAPDGFKLAGDINGILVCYKTSAIPMKSPPILTSIQAPVLSKTNENTAIALSGIKTESDISFSNKSNVSKNHATTLDVEHDYEEIETAPQVKIPQRPAPAPPKTKAVFLHGNNTTTLGTYSELEGVPFMLNSKLIESQASNLPKWSEMSTLLSELDYDFQLERQILCTIKSSASKNPFFK